MGLIVWCSRAWRRLAVVTGELSHHSDFSTKNLEMDEENYRTRTVRVSNSPYSYFGSRLNQKVATLKLWNNSRPTYFQPS